TSCSGLGSWFGGGVGVGGGDGFVTPQPTPARPGQAHCVLVWYAMSGSLTGRCGTPTAAVTARRATPMHAENRAHEVPSTSSSTVCDDGLCSLRSAVRLRRPGSSLSS